MKSLLLVCLCVLSFSSFSQRVIYPKDRDAQKLTTIQNYQIEGKIKNNILVFENDGDQNLILIYNDSMQLKKKAALDFLPKETLTVNFCMYSQFVWVIYVYQKRKILYCMAVKITGEAKPMNKPVLLDSSRVNSSDLDTYGFSSNKYIYDVVQSKDQSKIVVFKKETSAKGIHISRILLNNEMQVLNHSVNFINCHNESFDNFSVNNEGDWFFTGSVFRDTYYPADIAAAQLFIQKNNEDTFRIEDIELGGKFLHQLVLKIDQNKNLVINSLYSRNNNIDGLFTATWNTKSDKWAAMTVSGFGNIKGLAKQVGENPAAMNQFSIRKIILRNDNSSLIVGEEKKRDYPSIFPGVPALGLTMEKISYDYNNILVLDEDSSGNVQWGNMIRKTQTASAGKDWFSFGMVLREETLDFIYNLPYKQTFLPDHKSISFDGKITDNPLMHGLRDNFILIPSRGKQISENEFVLPCVHKNTLYFTKIQF